MEQSSVNLLASCEAVAFVWFSSWFVVYWDLGITNFANWVFMIGKRSICFFLDDAAFISDIKIVHWERFFYLIPYLFCVIMRTKCMVTDAETRRSKWKNLSFVHSFCLFIFYCSFWSRSTNIFHFLRWMWIVVWFNGFKIQMIRIGTLLISIFI